MLDDDVFAVGLHVVGGAFDEGEERLDPRGDFAVEDQAHVVQG